MFERNCDIVEGALKIALIIFGLLGIITTILPIIRKDNWWIRIFNFPRLQITMVLITTLGLYLTFVWNQSLLDIAFLFALAASLAHQGFMMYPYTTLARKQVRQSVNAESDSTFTLLFANVLQKNRNAGKLMQIISEADPDKY